MGNSLGTRFWGFPRGIVACACVFTIFSAARAEDPLVIDTGNTYTVDWLAFGYDGETLLSFTWAERKEGGDLSGKETTIHSWDTKTGKSKSSFTLPGRPFKSIGGVPIALSPDGRRLAWQPHKGDLLIVDAGTGKVLNTIPRGSPFAQRRLPDPRQPALPRQPGARPNLRERLENQPGERGIQMSQTILGLMFSPDGTRLAVETQGAVAMYDTATNKRAMLKTEFAWPKNELPQVVSVGFAGQGYGIACCTADGTVRRYDTITGKPLGSAKITIDGAAPDAGEKRRFVGGALRGSAIFSPDGATIAALDEKGIALWDVVSGKKLRTLEQERTAVFGKRLSVSDIHNSFSPSGSLLVSPFGKTAINVWDTHAGTVRQKIELGDRVKITSSAVAQYDNLLAAGDTDGKIRIWKLAPKSATPASPGENQAGE
jgi:WD40 repeat protein